MRHLDRMQRLVIFAALCLLVADARLLDAVVTVIQIADTLTVLARNELGEGIYATPAVAGDHLHLRTVGHLYAFGPGRCR